MKPKKPQYPKLILLAADLLRETLSITVPPGGQPIEARAARLLMDEKISFTAEEKKALKGQRSPPEFAQRLILRLGKAGLLRWAVQNYPRLAQKIGHQALSEMIHSWLTNLPVNEVTEICQAIIEHQLTQAGKGDTLIKYSLGLFLSKKETMMNANATAVTNVDTLVDRLLTKYFFDTGNALPKSFENEVTRKAYIQAVGKVLERFTLDITNENNDYIVAAIIGTMLQLGRTELTPVSAFEADVRQGWGRLFTTELGNTMSNNEIYRAVDQVLRPAATTTPQISFQQFAYVGEALTTGETRVPPGDPNFVGLVQVAAQNYLASRTTFSGLGDLPPLISEDSGDNEIEADNVRAVAWVYTAHQYEQMRMFDVVDRITELFMNGMLPIGLDTGGHALDRYYWDNEDRLTPAARHSHYTRVLGVSGGDVSREVQPNTEFNNLWMRFLSSLAEFDRQFRLSDLFQQRRGLATTGEHVRKAGRDLAANASLYGWAATHFVARRLEKQIRDTINILNLPSIQKAYAVNSAWQLIERVAATEFGQAPNMVRQDTMARAGKIIMDLVATHARVWSRTTGTSLFSNGPGQYGGDINDTDRDTLMTQTQYWLAVNGIKDDQIDQMSQPVASVTAPSIPPSASRDGSPNLDQIRQMVTQGQMPSLDQLQQMVGMSGNGRSH